MVYLAERTSALYLAGDTMINKFMGPLAAIFIFSKPFLKSLQQVCGVMLQTPRDPAISPILSSPR